MYVSTDLDFLSLFFITFQYFLSPETLAQALVKKYGVALY
jgi:hypothetical protein